MNEVTDILTPYVSPIPELIEEIRQGRMVVVIDDPHRENEGDLIMAAECVEPKHINFMTRYGRGLVCLPLSRTRCEQLGLPLMVQNNQSMYHTNFTVSIEAAQGVTTGISCKERAHTIRTAVAAQTTAQDLVRPGHIFPIMAHDAGVLGRPGHTEASCDLAELAGFSRAGVLIEILNDAGEMARGLELVDFAQQHGLKIGTIADLIAYKKTQGK